MRALILTLIVLFAFPAAADAHRHHRHHHRHHWHHHHHHVHHARKADVESEEPTDAEVEAWESTLVWSVIDSGEEEVTEVVTTQQEVEGQ